MQDKQEKKISVIVPVYKVELYLRQCIESILAQTYNNLEIILVDDGSPDNCGAICDEYAKKDGRVTVIHKKNEGVSAARNTGIDAATGGLLSFVDSDDWIDSDMFEALHGNMAAHDADISCCGYYTSYVGANITPPICPAGGDGVVLLDKRQAVKEVLLNKRVKTFLWGKLYKKSLFDYIRCPVDMAYCEDAFIIGSIFSEAEKTAACGIPKYYYRQRKSSAAHEEHNIKIMRDGLKAAGQNYNLVQEKYAESAELIEVSECNIISSHISALKKIIYRRGFRKSDEYRTSGAAVRKNYKFIMSSPHFNKADKISAACIKTNVMLFKAVHILYRKSGEINNKILFE